MSEGWREAHSDKIFDLDLMRQSKFNFDCKFYSAWSRNQPTALLR
jgi:hypothetical protein